MNKNIRTSAAVLAASIILALAGCTAPEPGSTDRPSYSPLMVITPGQGETEAPETLAPVNTPDAVTTDDASAPASETGVPATELPPTERPTERPADRPTQDPTERPTEIPATAAPTETPTETPTGTPTDRPADPTEKTTWDPSVYYQEEDSLPFARYYLEVSLKAQLVYIYSVDENNEPLELVKTMICSSGRDGKTPVRSWIILNEEDKERLVPDTAFKSHYEFEWLADGAGQYMSRMWKLDYGENGEMKVSSSGFLFHSVPYYSTKKDTLETEEWNKLGTPASLGCIRLCVRDAHWIWLKAASGSIVRTVEGTEDPETWARLKLPDLPPDVTRDPTDIY